MISFMESIKSRLGAMRISPHHAATTRRIFLMRVGGFVGSFGVAPTSILRPAAATPVSMAAAIHEVVGEAAVRQGKVKLDIPPLVENGNAVSLTVSADSPMTNRIMSRASISSMKRTRSRM